MNLTTPGQPAQLTLARLFDSPGLSGPLPGPARFSPDGRQVAWLRAADDDFERLDLWLYDLEQTTSECLLDARTLTSDALVSEAETARRERLRIFAHGITEFHWQPDGRALWIPIAGQLNRLTLPDAAAAADADTDASNPEPRLEVMTPETLSVSHVQIGPQGQVAFIHDQNLWLLDQHGQLRQLTTAGGGTLSYGLPDFIAQEEMHRFEGFWFSPCGQYLAFTEVDEAPVPATQRYEMDAGGLRGVSQHYPFTGGPNPAVRLGIMKLADGSSQWLDWAGDSAEYLARVNWLPDSSGLMLQRQPRDQQTLELVRMPLSGAASVVHRETSTTWVNLHDDLYLFREQPHLALWSSEQSGQRQLLQLNLETGAQTPVTPEDGMLLRLVAVDEASQRAYVEGWFEQPTQQHLYVAEMAAEAPAVERLTPGGGCHQTRMAPDFSTYLDRREDLQQPPCLEIRDLGGSLVSELVANRTDAPAHPYHPFKSGHRPAQLGELEAADGQKICYRLTPPAVQEEERCPVIVSVYGGPGVQRVRDAWPPLMHQYLARRGWGVLELDNRGMGGRGRHFEAPIHQRLGQAEVEDQMLGVEMLQQLDWVDPDRIAVFGHSYGGYMALMCLAQHPRSFCAAVAVAPVTDWRLYDTHYTERYLGDPAGRQEAYDAASVLNHVEGLAQAAPESLLLVHGMADDNVLFNHSVALIDALQNHNVQFQLMAYPGARHGIAGRTANLHRFTQMERFLSQRFGELPD